MKLLEFSGWRVVLETQEGRLLINPGGLKCSDDDVVIVTQMGLHEMGRQPAKTLGPCATTGAAWKAGGADGVLLGSGAVVSCDAWEFTWQTGQPGILIGRSPTASFMFVDGVPHQTSTVAREAVDCVLIPGDTGKWLSVALGRSHGFEWSEHESRLRGIANILNAAGSPWVLGEPQEELSQRLSHVAADVSQARYFLDIQAFIQTTPAATLFAQRYVHAAAAVPFEPELAGDCHSYTSRTLNDQTAAVSALRSLVLEGELAAIAARWNACLQVTLVDAAGERKVWRDFKTDREIRSGEGPNELANLFVRCTPRAIIELSEGSRGILSVLRDGSLSCWTKLWRIDELGRFCSPVAEGDIPTGNSIEPAHLLWHCLTSLDARIKAI